eukprot:TRINITY_DN2227_c0_g1_i1.p2 TRINITY_DN2227_c0_g1~~TRINITY_DN2227_c0_g1_i1.p2  ORF type:complete len:133 (-),score=49.63 TRINITY_DN2227_c0_g1_i1:12-410(-)
MGHTTKKSIGSFYKKISGKPLFQATPNSSGTSQVQNTSESADKIQGYAKELQSFAKSMNAKTESNGFLMRITPLAIYGYKLDEDSLQKLVTEDSKMTHVNDNVMVAAGCYCCLLYTSPSPRDKRQSRMPSSS